MLQRTPETSGRAIKLPGFIGHAKLHGNYCWKDDKSSQVVLYGWCYYYWIIKLCGIHIDLICFDKNMVSYNSSYHIKMLHITAITRLLCQLQFNQISNMLYMVSHWCLCKNTATSRFMKDTFLRLTYKQILFASYVANW